MSRLTVDSRSLCLTFFCAFLVRCFSNRHQRERERESRREWKKAITSSCCHFRVTRLAKRGRRERKKEIPHFARSQVCARDLAASVATCNSCTTRVAAAAAAAGAKLATASTTPSTRGVGIGSEIERKLLLVACCHSGVRRAACAAVLAPLATSLVSVLLLSSSSLLLLLLLLHQLTPASVRSSSQTSSVSLYVVPR